MRKSCVTVVLACSCVVAGASVCAAPLGARGLDPYLGVVANGTISFIGQEFYREFVANWRDQPQAEQFSISIQERPSARWGSLIWVEYANRQLFRAFLSPGQRDNVKLAAQQASAYVYQRVIDHELERNLYADPDMAPDEM